MTVSTELSHEEYTGNGVTTDFDFRFRIFEAKHLVVSVADPDGTERILTNGTDYTLRGVGSYRGGKVILKMPLATGWKIGIARDLPAVQETDLRNQGKFFAEVHEDAFDYLTMLIQKSLGYLSLCLRKPSFISDHYDAKGNKISNLGKPVKDGDAVDLSTMKEHISAKDKRTLRVADKDIPALPNTANRANKLLSFDNIGNPVVIVPESGSAADVLTELGKQDGFALIGGLTDNYLRVFDNVAEMVAETSLPLGATVKTRGYYTINDGGGAEYTVTNAAANGITDITLSNGLTASMLTYGDVDIRTVGCRIREDVGPRINELQEIARVNTVIIPRGHFYCNTQINVRKSFFFKDGAQIINQTLRDDMFVFETDGISFRSDKRGGGRIEVDPSLTGWGHNVALVLGKNNLRNLTIENVKLWPNWTERLGTSLRIRMDNVRDGSNDDNKDRRWNSVCWCNFNGLHLEYGKYGLYIEAYEPTDNAAYTQVTNWITACNFKNNVIRADNGIVCKCVPKIDGRYAYHTQIGNLEFESIQQWTSTSVWAVKVDGGGMNIFKHFVWDYSYYGAQGKYLVDVRGDDGRDNKIVTNLEPSLINFNTFSNIFESTKSREVNAVGLRRICNISKKNGTFVINTDAYKPRGVNKITNDTNDDYNIIIEYEQGVENWRPYIFTQSLTQNRGWRYSLIPLYNQSGSLSGKAFFNILNNETNNIIRISELPDGVEFHIEIVCTN
ncbi:hypothetical protein [Morganella morganii]|uniref:hypothetical protein n=1 Tax=Morganella morganii TaxID=582 RepID=UPI0016497271|nr:hypothetical protein [Morganella morganii]MBC3999394.1 hypothetical protein [Morganella morganii]MBT0477942.1 hypothetical protein [Morganella morganii subsp. morganii]MBT0482427.1 hypothetical protein [Morganella morganii subsp. morganii]UVZ55577.1 hypothetical protein NYO97_08410 [Morganella morganii]HBC7184974.1 hypothetical protein [Morganella morganii]